MKRFQPDDVEDEETVILDAEEGDGEGDGQGDAEGEEDQGFMEMDTLIAFAEEEEQIQQHHHEESLLDASRSRADELAAAAAGPSTLRNAAMQPRGNGPLLRFTVFDPHTFRAWVKIMCHDAADKNKVDLQLAVDMDPESADDYGECAAYIKVCNRSDTYLLWGCIEVDEVVMDPARAIPITGGVLRREMALPAVPFRKMLVDKHSSSSDKPTQPKLVLEDIDTGLRIRSYDAGIIQSSCTVTLHTPVDGGNAFDETNSKDFPVAYFAHIPVKFFEATIANAGVVDSKYFDLEVLVPEGKRPRPSVPGLPDSPAQFFLRTVVSNGINGEMVEVRHVINMESSDDPDEDAARLAEVRAHRLEDIGTTMKLVWKSQYNIKMLEPFIRNIKAVRTDSWVEIKLYHGSGPMMFLFKMGHHTDSETPFVRFLLNATVTTFSNEIGTSIDSTELVLSEPQQLDEHNFHSNAVGQHYDSMHHAPSVSALTPSSSSSASSTASRTHGSASRDARHKSK